MNLAQPLMKILWRTGAIVLVMVAVFLLATHFRGASALAKWQRQMRLHGAKLSIDELAPPPGPHNDTNLIELQRAAGRLETRAIIPAEFATIVFTAPGRAEASWALTELHCDSGKIVDWSKVRSEMEAARDDLDRIGSVLIHPSPNNDLDYHDNTVVRNYVASRVAAQWLAGAILYELHEGRLARAQKHLSTSINLIRLHKDELTLVNQMIRVAIANLELETTWTALQAPGWTDATLAELQHDWESVQFLEKFAPSMWMERAQRATFFAEARKKGIENVRSRVVWGATPSRSWEGIFRRRVLDPAWRMMWADADELYFWQSTQPGLDAVNRAVQHKSYRRLRSELLGTVYQSTASLTGYDSLRYRLSILLKPNFLRAHESVMRAETQRNLTVAAIAIQRHQLRHGGPPPNLAALVPEFLESVPIDYMDGQPLRYRLEADGGFCLYSVGLDGQDDGGDSQPAAPWRKYSDAWDGRDNAWPRRTSEKQEESAPAKPLPLVVFEKAPLVPVLKTLARQADMNIAFDPNVNWGSSPPVSLRLENVTAEDVLKAVLNNCNLTMTRQPGTNLVGITTK